MTLVLALTTHSRLLPDSLICLIDSACVRSGLSLSELGFEKKWVEDDTFRLPLVTAILDEPLALARYGDEFGLLVTDSLPPSTLVRTLAEFLERPQPQFEGRSTRDRCDTNLDDTISVVPGLSGFLTGIAAADSLLELFYAQLSRADRRLILYQAIDTWSEDDGEDYRGRLLASMQNPDSSLWDNAADQLYTVAARTDLTPLLDAFAGCATAMQSLSRDPKDYQALQLPARFRTPWGNVLIAAQTDDFHQAEDLLLLIDPGGDDSYRNGFPRAIGSVSEPALQFCLDLAGDDLYHGTETAVAQGSAVLGIAWLEDCSGRDTYLGAMHAQGSALMGCALLHDRAGDDIFRADFFAQAAGHFGIGLLLDESGDDLYHATAWCQGMGGTFGCGALIDRDGDDRYSAGGAYLHKPLRPRDYRSFAQGFAMGYRDRAGGGIGLLLEGGGNDFYNAEIYAQGCSYWYALGVLLDQAGNDQYLATQYAQGAGIHLSCGLLADQSGDDHYYSRFGPSLGTGHDYSVGMLLDAAGNDNYMVSGGIGVSLTNSFGMLLDGSGDDVYSYSEVWGVGAVRHGRGYAGHALFLDLDGRDVYPAASPGANDSLWHQHDYGLGWDRTVRPDGEPPGAQEEADSLTDTLTMPLDSLWSVAVKWGVGSNRIRVPQARRALATRIEETVPFLREERKLDTSSGLVRRALVLVTKGEPEAMAPLLVESLRDSSEDMRVMSLGLLADTLFTRHAAIVAARLDTLDGRELRGSLLTLGEMRSVAHIPLIASYLSSPQEKLRQTTIRALAATYAPEALPHLLQGLLDPLFTIRSGVVDRLDRFPVGSIYTQLPAGTPRHERELILRDCLRRAQTECGWWTRWRLQRRLRQLERSSSG